MNKSLIKLIITAAVVILLLALPEIFSGNQYFLTVLVILAINILLVASIRTVLLIDQISLGQVGFSIIGAYTSALLMLKANIPFWASLPISGLVAAAIAFILGYPFLKVKGIYFSILTLLVGETFREVAYNWTSLTGGNQGLVGIPSPNPLTLPFIGMVKFDFLHISNYYYLAIIIVLLCLLVLYLIERSHINFKWRAIKDADELANSVGINVIWYKMINFTIACFFAGIAGALFAHFQHNLSVDTTSRFSVTYSILLLVYMVIGGQGSFLGPILGTTVMAVVTEASSSLSIYLQMIQGAIAITVMLFLPNGLVSLPSQIKYWFTMRKAATALKEAQN